jgi:hypothetical protein
MGATATLSVRPERTDAHVGLLATENTKMAVKWAGLRSKLVCECEERSGVLNSEINCNSTLDKQIMTL